MPHDAAVKAAGQVKESELYVWHPGMTVKLEVTVVGDEAYRKGQIDAWTSRLKEQGITVEEGSGNVLRANSFFMSGPASQYKAGNETVTIARQVVGYDIVLTVGGKETWKSVNNVPPKAGGGMSMIMLSVKQGKSA